MRGAAQLSHVPCRAVPCHVVNRSAVQAAVLCCEMPCLPCCAVLCCARRTWCFPPSAHAELWVPAAPAAGFLLSIRAHRGCSEEDRARLFTDDWASLLSDVGHVLISPWLMRHSLPLLLGGSSGSGSKGSSPAPLLPALQGSLELLLDPEWQRQQAPPHTECQCADRALLVSGSVSLCLSALEKHLSEAPREVQQQYEGLWLLQAMQALPALLAAAGAAQAPLPGSANSPPAPGAGQRQATGFSEVAHARWSAAHASLKLFLAQLDGCLCRMQPSDFATKQAVELQRAAAVAHAAGLRHVLLLLPTLGKMRDSVATHQGGDSGTPAPVLAGTAAAAAAGEEAAAGAAARAAAGAAAATAAGEEAGACRRRTY